MLIEWKRARYQLTIENWRINRIRPCLLFHVFFLNSSISICSRLNSERNLYRISHLDTIRTNPNSILNINMQHSVKLVNIYFNRIIFF